MDVTRIQEHVGIPKVSDDDSSSSESSSSFTISVWRFSSSAFLSPKVYKFVSGDTRCFLISGKAVGMPLSHGLCTASAGIKHSLRRRNMEMKDRGIMV